MFSPIQRDVERPGGESGHLNSVRVFCCVCGCWGLSVLVYQKDAASNGRQYSTKVEEAECPPSLRNTSTQF